MRAEAAACLSDEVDVCEEAATATVGRHVHYRVAGGFDGVEWARCCVLAQAESVTQRTVQEGQT